ncbi:hypothetical protein BKA24_001659 [Microbacterium marinum]|uniref:Putative exodeoxyribonuclease 8 PDDEXK-like domain-containing protein n=1 Tax=Microbacterium marinum TaxID=421115 RepID=A0A7W7FJ11_9MICO|nr:PD-(D/E)XK nuclease-like domain-containing protein [Microbacterium marinum]MBB4666950.1 hypothetical protein [Microbacterium marinum]
MSDDLDGLVLDLDESVYHAHPALSSTGARQLLVAPAKFEHARRNPSPPKKVYDIGTATHSKVLGIGAQAVAYPTKLLAENGAASTKAAKAWADVQRAAGRVPMKQHEIDVVDAMAESVLAHRGAAALLEQVGPREASVFSTDPETGVPLRCRFDLLGAGGGRRIGVDLKTKASDATATAFARAAADLRYDVQQAHYEVTAAAAEIELDGFAFIVVEKEPPYLANALMLDADFVEIGVASAAAARRLFAAGIESGMWPGYPQHIQLVRPPMWAIYDHTDRQNTENQA